MEAIGGGGGGGVPENMQACLEQGCGNIFG
jgi:hypothetical protein